MLRSVKDNPTEERFYTEKCLRSSIPNTWHQWTFTLQAVTGITIMKWGKRAGQSLNVCLVHQNVLQSMYTKVTNQSLRCKVNYVYNFIENFMETWRQNLIPTGTGNNSTYTHRYSQSPEEADSWCAMSAFPSAHSAGVLWCHGIFTVNKQMLHLWILQFPPAAP